MNKITNELAMVRNYAIAWNTLNYQILEPLLAESVVYESQEVLIPLKGKETVLDFIHRKMESVKNAGEEYRVFAEIGYCGCQKGNQVQLFSAYEGRPTVVIRQGKKEEPICLVLLEIKNNLIERIDLCSIAPHPSTAIRTGIYPTKNVEEQKPVNNDQPRLQHYIFAHIYLPQKLHESPQLVRNWLTGEKALEHLITRWNLLRMSFDIKPEECFSPLGMRCEKYEIDKNQEVVLICFPMPERITEAYFGAIVFEGDRVRYFTLEKTYSKDEDNQEAIFGEWLKGIHLVIDCCPLCDSKTFFNKVIEKIDPLSQEILLEE